MFIRVMNWFTGAQRPAPPFPPDLDSPADEEQMIEEVGGFVGLLGEIGIAVLLAVVVVLLMAGGGR